MGKKLYSIILVMALITIGLTGCGGNDGSTGETNQEGNAGPSGYPERTVELVVPFSAGGGSDVFARTVVKIISDYKMVDQTINVVNKTGGSGSIGYAYLAEKKGDPYYMAVVGSSFYSSPLIGQSPVSYKDFVTVGALADDTVAMFVKEDSRFDSLDQILEEIRANPNSMTIGGTGGTALDALAYYMLQDRADVAFSYVPYDGGGEALTALLGGHVDIVFANPSEALAQLEAGKIKMLVVASEERIPGFEEIPTFIEQGLDIELSQIRGFLMPADTPQEIISYWEGIFKQVYETEEFQKNYLEANTIIPLYLTGEEYLKEFDEVTALYTDLFEGMGILKNRLD